MSKKKEAAPKATAKKPKEDELEKQKIEKEKQGKLNKTTSRSGVGIGSLPEPILGAGNPARANPESATEKVDAIESIHLFALLPGRPASSGTTRPTSFYFNLLTR